MMNRPDRPFEDLQKRADRLQRLYDGLRKANHALIRSDSEGELFQSFCDIAWEYCDFRFVRFNRRIPGQDWAETKAWAGHDVRWLDSIQISTVEGNPLSCGPTGLALRTGKSAIVGDVWHDPDCAPWLDILIGGNIRSAAAFPVFLNDAVYGAITFYGTEVDEFNSDVIPLLEAMAEDLSHALVRLDETTRISFLTKELVNSSHRLDVFRLALETIPMGVLILDPDGLIEFSNDEFNKDFAAGESWIGQNWHGLSVSDPGTEVQSRMAVALRRGQPWREVVACQSPDGEDRWWEISLVPTQGNQGQRFVSFFYDTTRLRQAEAQADYLLYNDPVTDLPNRTLAEETLAGAISAGTGPVSVLLVNLDRFRIINDSLGPAVADTVLREAGQRIVRTVGDVGKVSGFGPDEFLVLFDGRCPGAELSDWGCRLVDVLALPYRNGELVLSASVGGAQSSLTRHEVAPLLADVRTALEAAKASGRNTFRLFKTSFRSPAPDYLEFRKELYWALHRGEFRLEYQPQVAVATGKITGVEALLRWDSPTRGAVPPSRFIPIAEDCGLIVPLGRWVLAEACRQGRSWLDQGWEPFTLAVNVSALQFERDDMVEATLSALDASGFDPHCLELEITESVLIRDPQSVHRTLSILAQRGIRFAIDDFGTGYSSLAYLKRLDVHKLKIDKSFVQDLSQDEDSRSIVQTIIGMAHSLGLSTLAEGVEADAELDILRTLGCHEIQGYRFGKPMVPDELVKHKSQS